MRETAEIRWWVRATRETNPPKLKASNPTGHYTDTRRGKIKQWHHWEFM